MTQQVSQSSSTVGIMVGMNGQQITIHVEANATFDTVLEDVHAAAMSLSPIYAALPIVSLRLSAHGSVFNSVESLLTAHVDGHTVHATYMTNVDLMSLAEVADELSCDEDWDGDTPRYYTKPQQTLNAPKHYTHLSFNITFFRK